jgi:hypothetical protein
MGRASIHWPQKTPNDTKTAINPFNREEQLSTAPNLHARRIMKNRPSDPILAEAHAIKDAISTELNHDVTALCHYLQSGKPAVRGRDLNQSERPGKRTRRTANLASS